MQPALKHSASAPPSADQPDFVAVTIPCGTGSCRVQVYAPDLAAPAEPPPRTVPAPRALAQR
jgi:hypothetical protein